MANLVGHAPFLDGDFAVTRDTLICKPDTELFVELVLAQIAGESLPPRPHVLELCTGSGCVAITFAKRLPGARRHHGHFPRRPGRRTPQRRPALP